MYNVIPAETLDDLQLDAGVILNSFDPSDPEITNSAIVTATTGGVTASCVPTFVDFGEDIDNCPNNTKEMKRITGHDVKLTTTALSASASAIRLQLGAADVNASTGAITPRAELEGTDFADLWWVGDKGNGGFIAVKILNALSTGGFSLKTTKNGKGQLTLELTGHVSINALNVVPMIVYSIDPEDTETYTYTAVSSSSSGYSTKNPKQEGWYVLVGDSYRLSDDTAVDANVTYYTRTAN